MLVSRICRGPAALCLDFRIFSIFALLRTFYRPKMLVFDVPAMRLRQLIFLVLLRSAQPSPTHSSSNLKLIELNLFERNGW